ncbi:Uncharacterised protein [Vibrio cholerae]|nr:Uncharacterised protein [Vibrio cholerae]
MHDTPLRKSPLGETAPIIHRSAEEQKSKPSNP